MIKFLTKVRHDHVTYKAGDVEELSAPDEKDLVGASVAVYHEKPCDDGVCNVPESDEDSEDEDQTDDENSSETDELVAEEVNTDEEQEGKAESIDDLIGEFDPSEHVDNKKSGKKSRK